MRGLRRFFAVFGPGVITGAADDDPSGIATYSIVGAAFGTRLLWCSPSIWPLMAVVQMTCARIGMVTGQGSARPSKEAPAQASGGAAAALFLANTVNIAADLAGMADAASLLLGVRPFLLVVVFAGVSPGRRSACATSRSVGS